MAWKICGTAVVLLLVLAVGLFRSKAQTQKSSPDTTSAASDKGMSTYLGLRNMALSIASTEKGQPSKAGPNDPLAVLMDIPTTHRTATIVAYADGTASIYISNGGGYLGGSQSHQAIHDASMKMISVAHKFQDKMQIAKQYPLPEKGAIFFYVVTNNGVYMARAPEAELNKRTHPLTELYAAGQEIITQYRLMPKP
jgi:hypothetical protein